MSNLGGFEKVLRVGEGRRRKKLQQQAAYVATLEPDFEELSDAELAAKTVEFKQRIENGEDLEDLLFEAFAAVREAFKRTIGVRLFDVQVMGGIVLHEGDIAEMKTGEGKTFVASPAALPERARGQERAPRHGQRLPGEARCGVGGARLRGARHALRVHREHDAAGRAPRGVRRRHHLRHELRVRLRLPPRQHGRAARGHRPARPRLRDRGRGRLDPHRRGADAADHLGRARGRRQGLLRLRPDREAARRPACDTRRDRQGHGRARRDRRRLPLRREVQDRLAGAAARSRRSSARSGSTTSTTRATSSSSTT